MPLGILSAAVVDDFVFYHHDDVDFAFEGVDSQVIVRCVCVRVRACVCVFAGVYVCLFRVRS
jgi:hypothetical protein